VGQAGGTSRWDKQVGKQVGQSGGTSKWENQVRQAGGIGRPEKKDRCKRGANRTGGTERWGK